MKRPLVAVTILTVFMVLVTLAIIIASESKNVSDGQIERQKQYCLKIIDSTVTLTKGERIIKEYHEIIVSSLPLKDREALTKGIRFDTMEEVNRMIEDFDG